MVSCEKLPIVNDQTHYSCTNYDQLSMLILDTLWDTSDFSLNLVIMLIDLENLLKIPVSVRHYNL